MIGDADKYLMRSVRTVESTERTEGVIEAKFGIREFIFREQRHMRRHESTDTREKIKTDRDLRILLRLNRRTEARNENSGADAEIGLKRDTGIPQQKIRADICHSQMNARAIVEILQVRRTVKDIQLES